VGTDFLAVVYSQDLVTAASLIVTSLTTAGTFSGVALSNPVVTTTSAVVVQSLAISDDGLLVLGAASGSVDTLVLMNRASASAYGQLATQAVAAWSGADARVAFVPGDTAPYKAVSIDSGGLAHVWNLQLTAAYFANPLIFTSHDGNYLSAVAVHPTDRRVVTCDDDLGCLFWNVDTGDAVAAVLGVGHCTGQTVSTLRWSLDGHTLFQGCQGTARLTAFNTSEVVGGAYPMLWNATLPYSSDCTSMEIHPAGQVLVCVGGLTSSVALLRTADGSALWMAPPTNQIHKCNDVAWRADGLEFVVVTDDDGLLIYDTPFLEGPPTITWYA
jgi:WD40 repeat protein